MKQTVFSLFALALLGLAPQTATAKNGLKATGYTISRKAAEVKGVIVTGGYTPQEVMAFVKSDCAGGQIGQFALVGKPKTRRGLSLQSFVTSCPGGPHARFQGTSKVTIEVERTPEGRNLAEFTYGLNGNIQYERAYK